MPDKSEVTTFMESEGYKVAIQNATLMSFGRPLTDEQKAKVKEAIEKNLKVESVKCKVADGFTDVYDCEVSAIVSGKPVTSKFRFTRDKDGKLHGDEVN